MAEYRVVVYDDEGREILIVEVDSSRPLGSDAEVAQVLEEVGAALRTREALRVREIRKRAEEN